MTVWQSCTLQLLIIFLLHSNCNTVHDRLLTEFHSTAIHYCFTVLQLYITRCITVLFRVLTRVALPPSLLVIFVLYGNCNTVHDRLLIELCHHISTLQQGTGIACWLERVARDRKVAGSNPGRSGGRIFFSGVKFVCWLLFDIRPNPRVTALARKRPRSFCQ